MKCFLLVKKPEGTKTQCANYILNKIANTFDGTYEGLKSTL